MKTLRKSNLDGGSLEMPEEEMSYPLIGQGLFEKKTGQGIVKILLIF